MAIYHLDVDFIPIEFLFQKGGMESLCSDLQSRIAWDPGDWWNQVDRDVDHRKAFRDLPHSEESLGWRSVLYGSGEGDNFSFLYKGGRLVSASSRIDMRERSDSMIDRICLSSICFQCVLCVRRIRQTAWPCPAQLQILVDAAPS